MDNYLFLVNNKCTSTLSNDVVLVSSMLTLNKDFLTETAIVSEVALKRCFA